jgi:DNA processing protein
MFTEEHLHAIALRKCLLIGDVYFRKLVATIGSATEVWTEKPSHLLKIEGIGRKTIAEIGSKASLHFAEKELDFCENNKIDISLRHLKQFPNLLNECDDAPAILYHKGSFNTERKTISMVGTRHVTAYGKKFVEDCLAQLSTQNISTVSGLALGTDTEVHEQSLANKLPTIAVLAHGFRTLYPSKNKNLAQKIIDQGGALITEFTSTQSPERENFIQRNRIVAGFSDATIVVESAFGGGSMSTATFANQYNRDVFALPGRISDKYSQGCNHLIMQNKASTISTIQELISQLNLNTTPKIADLFQDTPIINFRNEQQKELYRQISETPNLSLDDLSVSLNLSSQILLAQLLEMELMNIIKSSSSRKYNINL